MYFLVLTFDIYVTVWTEITSVKSLQYDLGVIQAATNNLSDENKIGGDGFGPLYKV